MSRRATVWVAGSWGTALATVLASKGVSVMLWTRDAQQAEQMNRHRVNARYLPNAILPENVTATTDVAQAAHHGQLLLYAAPAKAMRQLTALTQPYVRPDHVVVHATKGFDPERCERMSYVLESGLPQMPSGQLVVLSGPSHAEEVVIGSPTTVVVASSSLVQAQTVQDWLNTSRFRVYTNGDVIGVELAGALKNMIALGAGMSDGLGYGDNAKAALMTRGLAEMTRLGVAMGAERATFTGLAGVGDLIVTCTSRHSRNWRTGYACGQGQSLDAVMAALGMVVEGVQTTAVACRLAEQYDVPMPIAQQLYRVLFQNSSPHEAVEALMQRDKTHET